MQNFSEGFWAESVLAGAFTIPEISAKEPFVAADDIADAVVEILRNKHHEGKIYELTGPELLSFGDVLAKISTALQHKISLVELPLAEYTHLLKEYEVPDDTIGLLKYLFEEVLDGRNEFVTGDIEQLLGRKATTFDAYLGNSLRSEAWSLSRTEKSN